MSTVSSGTVTEEMRSYFFAFTQPTTTAPDVSWRSPATTESDTVTTATRIRREARGERQKAPRAQSASVLVERHVHDRRWNPLATDLDFQSGAFDCRRCRHVGCPDWNPQRRAHGATPHLATRRAVHVRGISVAGERSLAGCESDQPASNALLFLF